MGQWTYRNMRGINFSMNLNIMVRSTRNQNQALGNALRTKNCRCSLTRAAHEYQVYPRTQVRYPWENPRNPYSQVSGTWFLKTRRVQVSILENSGTCVF